MARSFDLDPVESVAVGTIGPAGRRQFFIRASGAGESVVLNCEKAHVQALVARIPQMLEEQGAREPATGPPSPAVTPGEAEWTIGELGLGGPDKRGLFVIVAREMPTQEDQPVETLATARFWARPEQLLELSRLAAAVVAAGRPACPHCGLPMDPAGHPCPAANGSRPVV